MQIDNVRVYGLAHSAVASGLPMLSSYDTGEFSKLVQDVLDKTPKGGHELDRLKKLARNPSDSGHANALKGVIVQANFTAPGSWWTQAQRYSHFTIISSMSTMHRLRKMIETNSFSLTPKVDRRIINILKECDSADIEALVDNCPKGLELTARVSTNYMQLRIMFAQRRNHRLINQWGVFCDWVETLPEAPDLITNSYTQRKDR